MRLSRIGLLSALAAVSVALIAGCGGGGGGGSSSGGNTTPQAFTRNSTLDNGDAALTNGELYEEFSITANSSGTATIRMESSDVDSFLIILQVDESGNIIASGANDDAAEGLDSALTFDVVQGQRFVVVATTFDAGEVGGYTLRFTEHFASGGSASASQSSVQSILNQVGHTKQRKP